MRNLVTSLLLVLVSAGALAQEESEAQPVDSEAAKTAIESTSRIAGALGSAAKAGPPTAPTIPVRRSMNDSERMANQKLCDQPPNRRLPICAESR